MPLDPKTQAQIQAWVASGDLRPLLSFIEAMKDQRDRAELLAQAYLHQVKEVSARARSIIEPMLAPKTERSERSELSKRAPATTKVSEPTKSKPQTADFGNDIL